MLLLLFNMLLLYFWFKTTQRTEWVKKKNNVGAAVLGLVILTGTSKRHCKDSWANWKCSFNLVFLRLVPFM